MLISHNQTQQTNRLSRPRRHLEHTMPMRVQRPFEVAHVGVLFGVHLIVGEDEGHVVEHELHDGRGGRRREEEEGGVLDGS